jgi:hypothetical protein
MPIKSKYVFIVSMDVAPEKEALFNEVYDTEHVPYLSKVPGVLAVTRFKTEPAIHAINGEKREIKGEGMARYVAMYEIESPDVISSKEWLAAGEKGRWVKEVRPFTTNRSHVVRKIIG